MSTPIPPFSELLAKATPGPYIVSAYTSEEWEVCGPNEVHFCFCNRKETAEAICRLMNFAQAGGVENLTSLSEEMACLAPDYTELWPVVEKARALLAILDGKAP